MKPQEINALIEKYYQGNTSEEEEKILRNYLKDNKEEKYQDVISQLNALSNFYEDDDVLDESFNKKILQELSKSQTSNTKLFNSRHIISGVAATILLAISIWIASSIFQPKEVYGTVTDPIAAFAETKKVLQKVSKNVKKGITPPSTTLKKAESGLKKTKNIKKLNNTGLLLKSMTKVKVNYGKS